MLLVRRWKGVKLRIYEITLERVDPFLERSLWHTGAPYYLKIQGTSSVDRKILILPFPTNNNDLITDKEKCLVVGLSHSILRIHLKLYVTLLYSWRALKDVDTPFVRTNGLRLLKDNPKYTASERISISVMVYPTAKGTNLNDRNGFTVFHGRIFSEPNSTNRQIQSTSENLNENSIGDNDHDHER
ncbi:hypothetical protein V1477_007439, partial [Vespula maculifrons]